MLLKLPVCCMQHVYSMWWGHIHAPLARAKKQISTQL